MLEGSAVLGGVTQRCASVNTHRLSSEDLGIFIVLCEYAPTTTKTASQVVALVVKNKPANAGDSGSIPG